MSLEADYIGGVTGKTLFSTTQTTNVCVTGGAVSEVTVPVKFQDVMGLGWHPDGVSKAALNVGWEGRGVALGKFIWGAGGWYLLHATYCAQLRLNKDFVHYGKSDDCKVSP